MRSTIEALLRLVEEVARGFNATTRTPSISIAADVASICRIGTFSSSKSRAVARTTDHDSRPQSPELLGRKIPRDEIKPAEMVLVGMTKREPIDVHDFPFAHKYRATMRSPRSKSRHALTAVNHHHACAGKSHHRGIALAHRKKRHAQIAVVIALVEPPFRIEDDREREPREDRMAPSRRRHQSGLWRDAGRPRQPCQQHAHTRARVRSASA